MTIVSGPIRYLQAIVKVDELRSNAKFRDFMAVTMSLPAEMPPGLVQFPYVSHSGRHREVWKAIITQSSSMSSSYSVPSTPSSAGTRKKGPCLLL
jgi:hypothetical protein